MEKIPKALDDVIVALMAKAPADRPWDAEAVGHILRELREKDEKKQNVAMVWPEAGSAAANPTRAGVGVEPRKPKATAKGKKRKSSADADDDGPGLFTRERLEIAGLVGGMLLIAAFVVYWLWPPGQDYLYRHAAPLMESSRRSDWIVAIRDYIDPLDSRFPDHPHREQTRAWRDKLALDEAENRARLIASPAPTPFSQPQTNGERQFALYNGMAARAEADGDEVEAEQYWRQMADLVPDDDPDDHKWRLLAVKRADDLAARIRDRRVFVEEQFRRAVAALQAGRPKEAIQIQAGLREKYGRFTDVADLFEPVEPVEPEPANADAKPTDEAE